MCQLGSGQDELFYSFNLDNHVPREYLLRGIDHFLDLPDLRQHLAPSTAQWAGHRKRFLLVLLGRQGVVSRRSRVGPTHHHTERRCKDHRTTGELQAACDERQVGGPRCEPEGLSSAIRCGAGGWLAISWSR
jgi:hypothetical protein